MELICEELRKHPTFKILMHYINQGWPDEHRMLPQEIHVYWNYRDELSVEDGLLTKDSKLLIPSTLIRKTLEQIHEGNQGIEKCILKARESVFWPGIHDHIWETVEKGNLPSFIQCC